MLLISQTMATYDEMSFRAICQRTLGLREGGNRKEYTERERRQEQKGEVDIKGMTGGLWTT